VKGAVVTTVPKVVVVTGVSRFLGARVASRLAADTRIKRVIGLDPHDPPAAFAGLLEDVELFRADARAASGAIDDLGAEAVVHLAVTGAPDAHGGGRAAMKEQNVIGTMQLLAAAQGASRLRKLVVRSSTAAYGASFRDPAVFTEDTEPRAVPRGAFARDILDIEGYVRGFRRRRPDVSATVLRFAPFISSTADTTLTRYFAQPMVPTVLGRDARLQFVHVDDALEILHRSVVEDHPGTFNVAGDGVVLLSQALRRAGRPILRLPSPAVQTLGDIGRRFGGLKGFSPELLRWLTYGRVLDTERLAAELSWRPKYSSDEAFADFAGSQGLGQGLPISLFDRLTSAVGGKR
jgi:UDP-glucose 4-epimerase